MHPKSTNIPNRDLKKQKPTPYRNKMRRRRQKEPKKRMEIRVYMAHRRLEVHQKSGCESMENQGREKSEKSSKQGKRWVFVHFYISELYALGIISIRGR